MELNVTKNKVTITTDSELNRGEYQANEIHFTFSNDFSGLVKKAMFFVLDKTIEVPIDSNGNCYVPAEAVKYGAINIFIGVYAYEISGEDLILRYSPKPVQKFVEHGSYVEDPDSPTPLTPSDKDLIEGEIQELRDSKVDKVTGKVLSTNDFTDEDKSNLDSNTSSRHSHSNKSVLDNTTASYTTSEKTKLGNVETGAQVNKIEKVYLNGEELPISNKEIYIEMENYQIHKLRRSKTTTSSTWEKYGVFNKNLVANATHDGTAVTNDYDDLKPWSDIYTYNYDRTNAIETAKLGDSNFKFDGTNGEVMTKFPTSYIKVFEDDDYDYIWFSAWKFEGAIKVDSFSLGRYDSCLIDNVIHSYSGYCPAINKNIGQFRTLSQAVGTNFGQLDWRYYVLQLFYLAEYADYNSQSKLGNGIVGMRFNANDKALVAESNTNRIIVSTTVGGYFDVGQQISIGTSSGNQSVAAYRTITAKESYSSDGVTGTAITFDGSAVNVAVNNVIWCGGQKAGGCDTLGMLSGCLANDSKHAVIYRGVENPFGNVYNFVDGINIKDYKAYVCYNPSDYVSDKITSLYSELGYTNYSTSDVWSTKLGFDKNHPFIRLTTEANNGSSSTGQCDKYYCNTGNRIVLVGGCFNSATTAGLWFLYCYSPSSAANCSLGSRLLMY